MCTRAFARYLAEKYSIIHLSNIDKDNYIRTVSQGTLLITM